MPITEDFVKHLMEQNAALLAQNAAMAEQISQLTKTVESLNQTIQKLQEQLIPFCHCQSGSCRATYAFRIQQLSLS